ncbi:aminopeptidase N [Nocardioides fonticola]|uniref:Aminopeptidase N n=1 Tax=Nocardioides fonticola TaxID=450363 RepID=A0ABP7XW17_9ACTN
MNPSAPDLPLRHDEAIARAALLDVLGYDLDLDLTTGAETFLSRTVLRFRGKAAGRTFVDLKPVSVASITLDGSEVDVDLLDRGRLPLDVTEGEHELVVRSVMRYRNDGEGLHRSVDPADGRHYVYGMSFMDAAPSVFACFDQPDLKAPYTVRVHAPQDWIVRGNGRAEEVEPGVWQLATTPPLATYFVTVVAGPYHLVGTEHDGIALSLSAKQSLTGRLEEQAEDILRVTGQSFDELHRLFGVRYAFGDYHQAFVPEFNAGAMENPGCVTIRDTLVFSGRPSRAELVWRAALIAHEMAHQWFGDLVTPRWWDDLWLNESFAEYLGNRVAAEATEFSDAWVEVAYGRRQWGLTADLRTSTHPVAGNGAVDAPSALQDFDGISYAKGSSILAQLDATLGDEAFFGGVRTLFEQRRFGTIELADVVAAWEQASGRDLGATVQQWLRTSGPDVLELDRGAGVLRRTPPAHDPQADRPHRFTIARATGAGWRFEDVVLDSPQAPLEIGADDVVVLDPRFDTWASTLIDDTSVRGLVDLLPGVEDELLRAAVWNNVRSSVHQGRLDPALAVDLAEASFPVEDTGATGRRTLAWVLEWLLPLAPAGSRERLHRAVRTILDAAEPGSERQLSAFRAAVATATDAADLRGWLTAAPAGIAIDTEQRWKLLVRLATLGAVEVAELDAALEAERTDAAVVEHTRARASLPTAEAKEYAWARFTGAVEVPNYELEAAGLGMWRGGQESVTDPYVERYFAELPATAAVRSGWVLALAAEQFFPASSVTPATLALAERLRDDPELPGPLRRRVSDAVDDLARRLMILQRYPR